MNNTWGVAIAVSAFLIQFILYGISLSFGIYVIELQKEFDQGLSLISSIGSIHFGIQLSTGEYFFSLTLQGYISYTSLTFYKVKYILIVGCIKCPMLKGKESKKIDILIKWLQLVHLALLFCK